ncbi:response regulator [Kamptonema cortianum]|nr:response regulator [Geitlerinema splendidum]MDK3160866.1 response regulator [Kamptonema cortianum]
MMTKVLFVDDEPDIELLTKQKYRKQVAEGTFDVLFALNGEEALQVIKENPDLEVVVTDINMPQMDGLVLLDRLKEVNPAIKTIVVSAYGDTNMLRSAMNKGAYDFVTKPINYTELGTLIETTLGLCRNNKTPLYTYQLHLAAAFPHRLDLNYPHQRAMVLWDAFEQDKEHLIAFGVSILPSPIPSELAVSIAHGLLRTSLQENPELSLDAFDRKLALVNPSLKAHALISQYHKGTHAFSFRANGEYKVSHRTGQDETILKPSQTALLNLGDVITLEETTSGTYLSLSCLK